LWHQLYYSLRPILLVADLAQLYTKSVASNMDQREYFFIKKIENRLAMQQSAASTIFSAAMCDVLSIQPNMPMCAVP
jgi:hypothetical protein